MADLTPVRGCGDRPGAISWERCSTNPTIEPSTDRPGRDSVLVDDADSRPLGGPLAVAAMTLGLLAWPIGFNLGAFGVVFYTDFFRVVVASTVLLLVVVIDRPYDSPWNLLAGAALALPVTWLVVAGFVVGSITEAVERAGFIVWLVVVLAVSVPVTLRLLVDMFLPDVSQSGSTRLVVGMAALALAVAILGLAVGASNDRFMTCQDFAIAGSAEPSNCSR